MRTDTMAVLENAANTLRDVSGKLGRLADHISDHIGGLNTPETVAEPGFRLANAEDRKGPVPRGARHLQDNGEWIASTCVGARMMDISPYEIPLAPYPTKAVLAKGFEGRPQRVTGYEKGEQGKRMVSSSGLTIGSNFISGRHDGFRWIVEDDPDAVPQPPPDHEIVLLDSPLRDGPVPEGAKFLNSSRDWIDNDSLNNVCRETHWNKGKLRLFAIPRDTRPPLPTEFTALVDEKDEYIARVVRAALGGNEMLYRRKDSMWYEWQRDTSENWVHKADEQWVIAADYHNDGKASK